MNGNFIPGVRYLQCFDSFASHHHPISQKRIVFDKYITFPNWIGINTAKEEKVLLNRLIRRRTERILQVMGAAHSDTTTTHRPISIFSGRKTYQAINLCKNEDVIEANAHLDVERCIASNKTQWDCDNGTFVNDFLIGPHSNNVLLL